MQCALYIASDRLYVLGGEAGSYRERGAYQDQDQDDQNFNNRQPG